MQDINQVTIIGRLTRDAELKRTNSGTAVVNLSIAVNDSVKRGDTWQEEAHFFDAVGFGTRWEKLSVYMTKRKQVAISGKLRQERWEKDGQKRSRVSILVNDIQLLGGNAGKPQDSAVKGFQDTFADPFGGNHGGDIAF